MSAIEGADGGAEARALRAAVVRLRASVMAVTFGLLGGSGLFVATVWLLIRGGDPVGPHLGLLRYYLPGYSVTWPGAFLGFGWGVVVGALAGYSLAWLYNRVAERG